MSHPPEPLAARIGREAHAFGYGDLDVAARGKVKLCLMDMVGCALEARALPWSRQAAVAAGAAGDNGDGGPATVIGWPRRAARGDAAFANGTMGHGLVREDMHAGAVSHLGVAILPALMALAEGRKVAGRDFIAAAVLGYEVGAQVGRAVIDAELARTRRPTGITGPIGAAAGGARLLGLAPAQIASAVALAANATGGLNEWAHTGGSEMFFHPGLAARSGVTAVQLAQAGAFGSPSALDGPAGLFASLGKAGAQEGVRLFGVAPEILAVYHKPVPACNFAQTASQAAIAAASELAAPAEAVASIAIRVPRAGALYPGCDFTGPFERVLQAKMSIQYCVASALIEGDVTERNFALLDDPRLHRLLALTRLEIDDEMTRAFPARQGGEVELALAGGRRIRHRLDDVVNASPAQVRARFRAACADAFGAGRAERIEAAIDGLDYADDAGAWIALLSGQTTFHPSGDPR
ncbi:hypothetical protein GCM10023144_42060 [Pigmentiphaga soli]|uniref:MmgE/PrpD family protein n=1 Tax=Pigmentiphaga soli TaxID=1007095 RepID=A0ABP8HML7_9BURK